MTDFESTANTAEDINQVSDAPSNGNDVIVGTSAGDYIKGSAGDDTIDGGANGSTGYWWDDMDEVHYDDALYVFNRSTGEDVKAFNIIANDDGSVTVQRLDVANPGVVASSDTLTNIERITFGNEGDRVEIFLDTRTNIWMWQDDSGARRMENIEGGILDDDIQGSNLESRLHGGEGNDVLRGDASASAVAAIVVAGGSHESLSMPTGGTASLVSVSLGTVISAPLVNSFGSAIDQADVADNAVVYVAVSAGTSGNNDAAAQEATLAANTTDAGLTSQISLLRTGGYEVTLWVDQQVDLRDGNGDQAGALILDVFDPNSYQSGDRFMGEQGNDYIDGGLSGNATEHTWRNNNEAKYSGAYEDFALLKMSNLVDGTETTFDNGTTVAQWWADNQTGAAPTDFAGLLDSLGLGRVAIEAGDYVVVHDTTGAEGTDVIKNVQYLSFSNEWVGLEKEVRSIDWRGEGEPAGVQVNGTLFGDVIASGAGYDEINAGAGNDYVDAGAGGDRIRKMSGNDFIDGGTSGSDYGQKWQDSDEVRLSGNLSRYDLKVIDGAAVTKYLADNFAGQGLTHDANNTYFLITDLSPIQSTGTTLVTNVDRLNFDDQTLWLNVSYNRWGHDLHSDDTTITADEIGIEGTRFDDVIRASDAVAGSGSTAEVYRTMYWDGEGDDVYLGDAAGSSIESGVGNDIIAAGGNMIIGDHQWFGRDSVRYQDKQMRYVIEEASAGDQVLDAAGNTLYDLTHLASGSVTRFDGADDTEGTTQQVGNYSNGFVIRDLMPDQFGGNGTDLLLGVEEVSFEGSHLNLTVSTYENTWADPNDEWYQKEINVQGTAFDDVIDTEADGANLNVRNWVNAHEGNDFIQTGGGGDEIRPGKGFDFIDGGASGTDGDSWNRQDQIRLDVDSGTFEYRELGEVEVNAFLTEHFAVQNYVYNASQSYYLLIDTNVIDGWGQKLITNIDRVQFSDTSIELQVTTNGGYDAENDHAWFDRRGTEFNDVVDNSGLQAILPSGAPAWATTDSRVSFELAGGDDIAIGGAEHNEFNDGKGNDIYVGRLSSEDGSSRDQVSYQNQLARYDIQKLSAGDMVYVIDGDASSELIYDLSQLSTGLIERSDGRQVDVAGAVDNIYVVRDLVSDAQGGSGVDLLVNIDQINVPNDWVNLSIRVWDQTENVDGEIIQQAGIRLSPFDDVLDLSQGAQNESGVDVASGRVEAGAGDDFVIGFVDNTRFTGGAGDDVFWDKTPHAPINWWNENQAQYSGPMDRYGVEHGFVEIADGALVVDAAGEIIWFESYAVNRQAAVKVTDFLSDEMGGDGTDLLIGMHSLSFANQSSMMVGLESARYEYWDYSHDMGGDDNQIVEGDLVYRAEGSVTDDIMQADGPRFNTQPEGWGAITVTLSAEDLAEIAGMYNFLLFGPVSAGEVPQELSFMADMPIDTSYSFDLYVEDAGQYADIVDVVGTSTTFDSFITAVEAGSLDLSSSEFSGQIYGKLMASTSDMELDGAFTLFDFESDMSLIQFIDQGSSSLHGVEGDDVLIGTDADDQFSGGAGDDLIIGGGNVGYGDEARYYNNRDYYEISTTWVKLVDNQVIAEASTQIDSSYQQAHVVTSLDTSSSNEGRDILVNIEYVKFKDWGSEVALVPEMDLFYDSIYPGVNINDDALDSIPGISIGTANMDEEISIAELLSQHNVHDYAFTVPTNDVANFDLTYLPYRTVDASFGYDVIYGLANNDDWSISSNADDLFRIEVPLEDLMLTQGTDESGADYVEITHVPSQAGVAGYGTNRLYDFEQISVKAPGTQDNIKLPLAITPSLEWFTYDRWDLVSIEDSLFDDVIDQALLDSYGTLPVEAAGVAISLRGGDDQVTVNTGGVIVFNEFSAKWDIDNGDDYIETGLGIDLVRYNNKNASDYRITYFHDANSNQLLDDGEAISLADFQQQVTIYDGAELYSVTGNTAIDLSTYLAADSVSHWYDQMANMSPDVGTWFDYNDGYYVQVEHLIPGELYGTGTDVLHDVEAIGIKDGSHFGAIDLLSGTGYMINYADGSTSDPMAIGSDLSLLSNNTPIITATVDTDILVDSHPDNVELRYDPNNMDEWCVRVRYYDNERTHDVILGTDGEVTFAADHSLYATIGGLMQDLLLQYPGLTSLQTQVTAYEAGQSITTYVKDDVQLGAGNDIIDLGGQGGQDIRGGGYMQDAINLGKLFINFDISYGELDVNGAIVNAEADFTDYVGTPGATYVRIEDKTPMDQGGLGIKYGFGVEWLSDGSGNWLAGSISPYITGNKVRVEATDASEVIAVEQLDLVANAVAGEIVDGVIVKPGNGDDVIIGLDHGDIVNWSEFWDLDEIELNVDIDSFDQHTVIVGLNSERTNVARDANGDVLYFATEEDVTAGYTVKYASLLEDVTGSLGDKLLIDIEYGKFASEGLMRYSLLEVVGGDEWGNYYVLHSLFTDSEFTFTADHLNELSTTYFTDKITLKDKEGDDSFVLPSKEFSVRAELLEGNDYVYIGEDLGQAVADNWYEVEYAAVNMDQFDLAKVAVMLDSDFIPTKDANGNWQLVDLGTVGSTEAILIAHARGGIVDYGTDLVIGVERIKFEDTQLQVGIRENQWTNDHDGSVSIRQEGSIFNDVIGIKLNADGTAMDVRNELNGNAGNDVLIGGDQGDYFNPGTGDDLVIGGANGGSANSWENQDQVAYDIPSFERLEIKSISVGFDAVTNTVLREAAGDIVINPLSTLLTGDFVLTKAYQVTDVISDEMGGLGTDILIGVESLNGYGTDYQLGLREEVNDWDNDGVIDWINIRGSNFGDVIAAIADGGDVQDASLIALSTEINTGEGNDIIYAGEGGDRIRPGEGNDFVDGGAHSGTNRWGGTQQDQVQFSNDLASYVIQATDFAFEAATINDASGMVAFTVAKNGDVFAVDGTKLYALANGERYVVVTDNTPIGGEGTNFVVGVEEYNFGNDHLRMSVDTHFNYDDAGLLRDAWHRGTILNDAIMGTDARDSMEGGKGNDTLVGQGFGDRLDGGQGNDVLIGGTNGNTGNDWEDLDRAVYESYESARAEITKVQVGINADGTGLLMDADGEVVLAPTSVQLAGDYTLIDAHQVTDLLAASSNNFGSDILVGVERLRFSDLTTDLLVNERVQDWNNDGVIDQVDINGTIFNDLVDLTINGGTITDANNLNAQNNIRTNEGDDTIFAYAGGDDIEAGKGNDFIDGGANGASENGWIRKDTARFDGDQSRYEITTTVFDGTQDLVLENTFKVLGDDGSIIRLSNPSEVITTITAGTKLVLVADLLPETVGGSGIDLLINVESLDFKDGRVSLEVEQNFNYDSEGNIQGSWSHGTMMADTLTGTIVHDWMQGNAGDDAMSGGAGGDGFTGGAGNDVIWGDDANQAQTLNGNDNASYSGFEARYVISMEGHVVDGQTVQAIIVQDILTDDLGGEGRDVLYGIESLSFSDNWVRVGVETWEHKDHDGNLMSTHYHGSKFADVIEGSDLVDQLNGNEGDDILRGYAGADHFEVGDGNDTVYGGEEGVDAWGNAGVDSVRFTKAWADYAIVHYDANGLVSIGYDAAGYIEVTERTDNSTGDVNTLYGVERIEFNDRSISFESTNNFMDADGDGTPDWIQTSGTDDADTIVGKDIDDVITAGGGDDIVTGNAGNDIISGEGGSDTIDGDGVAGSGLDVFGIAYVDVAKYAGNRANFTIAENANGSWSVTDTSTADVDTLLNIEQITFSDATLSLTSALMSRDFNRDGTIDLYQVSGTLANNNYDVTDAGFADDWGLSATNTNTYLDLGEGNDTAVLGSGDDTVVAGTGIDTYDGGGGDGVDTLRVSGAFADITLNDLGNGSFTIGSGLNLQTFSNFEQVQFDDGIITLVATTETIDTNGDGVDDIGVYTGTEFPNSYAVGVEQQTLDWQLIGNGGDDTLSAGSGDDLLIGGAGNNTLDGGAGQDTAAYAGKSSDYVVAAATDDSGNFTVTEKDVEGGLTDTLISIETLEFKDGLVSLEVSETVLSSFSLATGVTETRYVEGTAYDDIGSLNSSTSDDVFTGNAGADVFTMVEAAMGDVVITDFNATEDTLQFNAGVDEVLNSIDISTWADASAEDKQTLLSNLLDAMAVQEDDGLQFNFENGDQLFLDGIQTADLTINNVDII